MKILTVVCSLGKGGTERAAQNFTEAYMLEGHDSKIIYIKEDGIRGDELRSVGIQVLHMRDLETPKLIREWQPEIIHLHSLGLPEEDVEFILHSAPKSRVVETNVFSTPTPWQGKLCCSLQLSKWCLWLYFNRVNGAVPAVEIPYPVRVNTMCRSSDSSIKDFRVHHGFNTEDIVIGRIGQSDDSKWSMHLMESFNYLRSKDERYRLLVVNPPTLTRRDIDDSPYKRDVCIIDEIIGDENLALAYSSIDIFVLIAEGGESFGMVLAESLLCQTPVVTLATPWADNSQGEVVGHEVGGIVANTPKDLRAAIILLANDEMKRLNYGKRGRQSIIDRYDYRVVARQVLDLLNSNIEYNKVDSPTHIYKMSNSRVGVCSRIILNFYSLKSLFKYVNSYHSWATFFSKILARVIRD